MELEIWRLQGRNVDKLFALENLGQGCLVENVDLNVQEEKRLLVLDCCKHLSLNTNIAILFIFGFFGDLMGRGCSVAEFVHSCNMLGTRVQNRGSEASSDHPNMKTCCC